MKVAFHPSIAEIGRERWDGLSDHAYPFISSAFLSALEDSGAVGPGTGWRPLHLSVSEGEDIVALLPLYLKHDSWGEFVFDFSWANLFGQYGCAYYPKLVNAIPFTPTTGPRYLLADQSSWSLICPLVADALADLADRHQISSFHSLFHRDEGCWRGTGFMVRHGCQFHWHNRGYRDFADYLDQFTSKRRRAVLKERAKVRDQKVHVRRILGAEMTDDEWRCLYRFYRLTFEHKSGYVPFEEATFEALRTQMADRILGVFAEKAGCLMGGALLVVGANCLYGRYWGAQEHIDCLHFEVCYYQGIEYAIEQKIDRFEPGAQGEFKILRGFEPVATWSSHEIYHPTFKSAIANFVEMERRNVTSYHREAQNLLPFSLKARR